jgi:hypothetical protein
VPVRKTASKAASRLIEGRNRRERMSYLCILYMN